MSSGIVLDNTVLSVFKRLDEIGLLKKILVGNVLIPIGVVEEYLQIGGYPDLEGFTIVDSKGDINYSMGKGETQAILLAREKNCVFATDDRRARAYANKFGVTTTGTIGLLAAGVSKGVITRQKALDILGKIQNQKLLYLSDEILEYAKNKIKLIKINIK
jgi:predicted nucleic acid-binding protein